MTPLSTVAGAFTGELGQGTALVPANTIIAPASGGDAAGMSGALALCVAPVARHLLTS